MSAGDFDPSDFERPLLVRPRDDDPGRLRSRLHDQELTVGVLKARVAELQARPASVVNQLIAERDVWFGLAQREANEKALWQQEAEAARREVARLRSQVEGLQLLLDGEVAQ